MGDGDGARGVCGRATTPKNVMSRTWYLARTLMAITVISAALPSSAGAQGPSSPAQAAPSSAAQAPPARPTQAAPPRPAQAAAPRPQPKEGEVQSDPIKCWWKADRTAVRVGER